MIIPVGTLINALAVIIGATIGCVLGDKLPKKIKESVFQVLGLCTLFLGVGMSLKTSNPLFVIFSSLLGIIIGELLDIEGKTHALGDRLKNKLKSKNTLFTEGFVASSLLFCIGSMAVLGPLNEGISGDKSIILTKSLLDFFASIAFAAAYGSGVAASALAILFFQGSITLMAIHVKPFISELMQLELEATGGVAILAIGLSLLGLVKIRLANLLPSLIIVLLLVYAQQNFLH